MQLLWTEDFKVGIAEIDLQHMELFIKINALFDAIRVGKEDENLCELMDFIGSYVVEHFEKEEALMAEADYDKFDSHKEEHKTFISKFTHMKDQIAEKKGDFTFALEVYQWLRSWIIEHVTKMDQEFGRFKV